MERAVGQLLKPDGRSTRAVCGQVIVTGLGFRCSFHERWETSPGGRVDATLYLLSLITDLPLFDSGYSPEKPSRATRRRDNRTITEAELAA